MTIEPLIYREPETRHLGTISLRPENIEAVLRLPEGARIVAVGAEHWPPRIIIGVEHESMPVCEFGTHPAQVPVYGYEDVETGHRWLTTQQLDEEQLQALELRSKRLLDLLDAIDAVEADWQALVEIKPELMNKLIAARAEY